jgi:hypothetical protein
MDLLPAHRDENQRLRVFRGSAVMIFDGGEEAPVRARTHGL